MTKRMHAPLAVILGFTVFLTVVLGACVQETSAVDRAQAAVPSGQELRGVVEVFGLPTSRTLLLTVDACGRNPVVSAQESEDEVIISVTVATSRDAFADCGESAEVNLAEPLGDRRVVDASSGSDLNVLEPEP